MDLPLTTIALDVTALRPQPSGIGYYVANLIHSLAQLQSRENFRLHLFYQPSIKNWLKGNLAPLPNLQDYPHLSCLPIPTTVSDFLSRFSLATLTYWAKYLPNPEIIHGTDHVVYPCPKSRKIITIHDLTFLKYPQYAPWIVKGYTARVKRCLSWSDLVITMAESTKADIINYLKVPPEKIWVIPLASRYSNYTNTKKPDLPAPYILFVGTLEPRKNVSTIVRAFDYLKQNYQIPHHLVLIGKKGWNYQDIFVSINKSRYQKDIHHLDYLADELVAQFYHHAAAFVYPSFYEGFGLPVLEAMSWGIPVITSNTSSLPEVVGAAAILVNPADFEELAQGIYQVIAEDNLGKQLGQKGKERAKLFSWEKTARQTLEAYRSLL